RSLSAATPRSMSFIYCSRLHAHGLNALQGHTAAPASGELQLSERKFQTAAIRLARFLRFSDALEQTAELDIGTVAGVDGQASLEVAARLPPELLLHAQLAQGEQQRGISGMLLEPSLRALEMTSCVARHALDVQRQQRRIPVRIQALLDNRMGFAALAQCNET